MYVTLLLSNLMVAYVFRHREVGRNYSRYAELL